MQHPFKFLLTLALLAILGSHAQAQVPLTGLVFDGSGGPLLSGTVYHTGGFTVPAGQTLTVQPGAIVKFTSTGASLTVNGTLDVNGISGSPAIFTSIEDDAAGGDTNANGAVAPAAGDWRYVSFTSSDTSTLDWCEVRYGGGLNTPLIQLNGSDISMANCTLRDGLDDGLDLNGNSFPTVSNCSITNCDVAVNSVDIDAVPGFTNNAASGNGGNYIRITGGTLNADATITTANALGGALVHATSINVTSGFTLTLEAGVVFKASVSSAGWALNAGFLDVNGTQANPVVLTSFADDSVAGDTNNDGASTGAPGDWRELTFTNSDASDLKWCEMRYGGLINAFLFLNGSEVSLSNCLVRDALGDAMWLNSSSLPTVRNCEFRDNGGVAVNSATLQAVPGFWFNEATGNAGGNYIRVVSASLNAPLTIEDHSVLGGALVLVPAISVGSGGHLILEPGVVLKLTSSGISLSHPTAQVSFNGTKARPVVVTSLLDDSIAGDTNGDGAATIPTKGSWTSCFISSGVAAMEHTLFRYGGAPGGAPVATVFANFGVGLSMQDVRVEHGAGPGFELRSAQKVDRVCAFDNQIGFLLTSAGFDLTRCTAVNSGPGFSNTGGHVGKIISSIGWGGTPNFNGIGAANLLYSNGDLALAGSNGNINTDPLFVDQVNGDLRLTALSPCRDTGDPAGEQDPDCTQADMGAEYFDAGGPVTYCTAKVNSLGCLPFVDYVGYASATDADPFTITGNDVLNNKSGLFFYGLAPHNGAFQGGTKCVLSPVKRTPIQSSGGNPAPNDCSGTYTLDMNARIQSGIDAALVPGTVVYGQFWGRDPLAPFTTALTNGVQFTVCP